MAGAVRTVPQAGRWREDLPLSAWRWPLLPAWAAFAAGSQLRRWAWDRTLTPRRAAVPVISVGNLVAGGAGKTPTAIALANRLHFKGRRATILSRGYRSGADGRNEEAALSGELPTVCDPDRVHGAARAIAAGADVLILDDGFQHRRLYRDVDIVVVDCTRPWGAPAGDGWMLPLGYRREAMAALARAHAVVLTRADLADPDAEMAIRARLAPFGLPIARERIAEWRWHPEGAPTGPVLLVSGIGNPDGFTRAALAAGTAAVEHWTFPDHHHYTAADAARIAARATALGATVVTTSKDGVKLAPLLPVSVLSPVTAWGQTEWAPIDSLIDRALGG
jgi:tetraacyldisaccharide 4'-kinase